jgi:Tfp pilus assembly protein PilX
MNKNFSSPNGSVLLMTLMFLVALTLLTVVFENMLMNNNTRMIAEYETAKAFYIAEAGLHQAIYYLKNTAPDGSTDGSWRTSVYPNAAPSPAVACASASTQPCQETLSPGSYTFWVESYATGVVTITSTGTYSGTSRTVRARVTTPPGGIVQGSWKECNDTCSN